MFHNEKRMLSMVNQKGSFYICKSKESNFFAHKLNYNILQIESLTKIPKYRRYPVLLLSNSVVNFIVEQLVCLKFI